MTEIASGSGTRQATPSTKVLADSCCDDVTRRHRKGRGRGVLGHDADHLGPQAQQISDADEGAYA